MKKLIAVLLTLVLAVSLIPALPVTAEAAGEVTCVSWWCPSGTIFIKSVTLDGQPLKTSLSGLTPGSSVTVEAETIEYYRGFSVEVMPVDGSDGGVYFFSPTGTPSVSSAQITVPDGDFKLQVGVESIGYVVDYYTDTGAKIETVCYDYGTTITVKAPTDFSPALVKEGWTFAGWSTARSGNDEILQPGDTFQAENKYSRNGKALFARWRENGACDITVENGKADKTSAVQGETVKITAAERENFTFTQWDVISGGVTLADREAAVTTFTMGEQNVSLKALYRYSGPLLTDFNVYIIPPVAGAHPQAPMVASKDYEISAYSWVRITNEDSGKMTEDDVFEEGSGILYQCKVDLNIPAYAADDADKLQGYVNGETKTRDGMDVMIYRSSFAKVKVVGSFNCAPALVNPFVDIYETDNYYKAVLWAYYAKPQVTNGMDADHFGPKLTVTRGQCAAFLWRAMGEPEPASTNNPFVDVPADQYYYKPILWAVEKGITKGTDAAHFSPDQTLSTAHIVTFLYRTLGKGSDGWYQEAALWAGGAGLMQGLTLAVDPAVDCPRANVVLFLFRTVAD